MARNAHQVSGRTCYQHSESKVAAMNNFSVLSGMHFWPCSRPSSPSSKTNQDLKSPQCRFKFLCIPDKIQSSLGDSSAPSNWSNIFWSYGAIRCVTSLYFVYLSRMLSLFFLLICVWTTLDNENNGLINMLFGPPSSCITINITDNGAAQ